MRRLSNTIGFDDAPFPRSHRGAVPVVGAVFAERRFDGVLVGEVEKDGNDAAERLAALIARSRFREHLQLILLQGITLAGFNVVDVFALHDRLALPVLVVARRPPDFAAIREALLTKVRDGVEKWAVIARLGPMLPVGGVHVQCVALSLEEAASVVERLTPYGRIPEPLRVAHLIAGALATGHSSGRA